MLIAIIGFALAGTTSINFDAVDVTANRPIPGVVLIQEHTRQLCPDDDVTSVAWQECVSNLSYRQIKEVCSGLGPDTPTLVDELMAAKGQNIYAANADGQVINWHGCLYNSRTGPRVESFKWTYAVDAWIMTDPIHEVYAARERSSMTVFDGHDLLDAESVQASGPAIELLATFAYILDPIINSPGSWIGSMARSSQLDINAEIRAHDLNPPYCDSVWPDPNCQELPRMVIKALSPTMMVVKTLLPQKVGYQVAGIFFQSTAGYDYTNE